MALSPVPTYAEVSVSRKDPRTGEEKSQFNPVWLKWFLEQQQKIGGPADLTTATGVLSTAQGGTGTDISANFSGTAVLAKLTVLGANGSLTVVDGLITAYVAPT